MNKKILFHSFGLSCLGGAVFLQALTFADILQHGYFRAAETNPLILGFEVALTGFSVVYFFYLYITVIRSIGGD